jgi:hypothetical protein
MQNISAAITTQLTTKEIQVLAACVHSAIDCSGGDFGLALDVSADGMNRHQIGGVLSSLEQKGWIGLWEIEGTGNEYQGTAQITFEFEGLNDMVHEKPDDLIRLLENGYSSK